jgi:DNA transformation protein
LRPDDIRELFRPTGPVDIRRMFGGQGIFRAGRMIAIVADGGLFMKTDAECRSAFEAAGSRPFSFAKSDGSVTVLSYWSLPDEALDDPEAMRGWVRLAEAAAIRASLAPPRRKRRAEG